MRRLPLLRAILWDVDGTLIESRQSIRSTINQVLAAARQPVFSAAQLDAQIGRPLRDILAEKCASTELVEALTHRYREVYSQSGWVTAQPMPGVLDVVEALRRRGIPQGIVTSKGQRETEILLQDLGMDHFDVVIGDDDRRPLKPHPAPVLAACAGLGLLPEHVAMVGDTTFDVQAAQTAGAWAVGVPWGIHSASTLREAGANVVRDARDLQRTLMARLA